MPNPSVSMPKDLRDDFDAVIWELKVEGELDQDAGRSNVIQQLMQEFVDEHRELLDDEGKQNPAPTVLAD